MFRICVVLYYWASLVAQLVRICLQCRRTWFDSWVRKIPWRRDRLPTPVFLGIPGGSDGKESACNMVLTNFWEFNLIHILWTKNINNPIMTDGYPHPHPSTHPNYLQCCYICVLLALHQGIIIKLYQNGLNFLICTQRWKIRNKWNMWQLQSILVLTIFSQIILLTIGILFLKR